MNTTVTKRDGTSVENAIALVLKSVRRITAVEDVPVKDALHRVCAAGLSAGMDVPHFNKSPLDGYALKSGDTENAAVDNPIALKAAARVFAGDVFDGVCENRQCIRIMTGAMIPSGCDCVIRQEDVELADDDKACADVCSVRGSVLIKQRLKPNENIIFAGEDIQKGTQLFNGGTVMNSRRLFVLSSLGMQTVLCYKMPRIAVLCTGSELVKPGESLPLGKIYNSNETLLGLRLKEIAYEPQFLDIAVDDAALVARQIEQIIEEIDVFISTGAVSVGEKDIFHEVFDILGVKKLFWGIAMRPGGAMLCGIYKDKPLFCLSGPPFAAFVNFEVVVRPALDRIRGVAPACTAGGSGIHAQRVWSEGGSSPRHNIVRAMLSAEVGRRNFRRFLSGIFDAHTAPCTVTPNENVRGSRFCSFGDCNCLLDLMPDTDYPAGSFVDVLLLADNW
ncbi:MAG: hypothetical protein Ta2B_03880 [Termitinemataceae bacterium]|nr:MAG: hypothetical protein Ta2B_03880 [Termitinemataceae bacterium]